MKKSILTTVSIIAVIALIGWVLSNNKKKNQAKTEIVAKGATGDVTVRIAAIKKTPVDLDFSVNGNFQAAQQLTFTAENSGRITKIFVDEGSRVNKGQVLATIDAETLTADLQAAQAAYQTALKDQERYESSFQTGGVTQQQLDQAKLNTRNALTRLQQAKIKTGDANIKAPFNGVVNKRFIEQGAYVSPGTQLFQLVDVSRLKLAVTVNETQVANLKVGDKVRIKSNVFPDKNFKGKVSFIAPLADNTLNFPVEIELSNNADNQLKAGMYGTAIFEFPEQAPAITVPRTAFVGSVSSNKIFVLENGNIARERKVVAGRVFGDRVEILEGLKEGETVIISGQINLVDGTNVSPIK
ncbi:efflux RND transporter periplasmic adaptor subunit [Rubrolithibacter danxiaensis]|uniref:efflux RND transporter periplasmic adaptor subunit n=1 Tax=Rubrolithibacter danxiaensis TaxID=3390805 RepID=UPI003BF80580